MWFSRRLFRNSIRNWQLATHEFIAGSEKSFFFMKSFDKKRISAGILDQPGNNKTIPSSKSREQNQEIRNPDFTEFMRYQKS